MEKTIGTVKELIGEHQALVLTDRKGACGDCSHHHHGCCDMTGNRHQMIVKVENKFGAQPGDHVFLHVNEKVRMKWMMALYFIPVIGAIAGALSGASIWQTDGAAIIAAVVGLILGLWLVRSLAGRSGAVKQLTPEIVGIQGKKGGVAGNGTQSVPKGCCA